MVSLTTHVSSRPRTLGFLAVAALVLAFVGLMVGPHSVPVTDTLRVLGAMLVGDGDFVGADAVISAVRVPRVLVALLVGAGLGVAGAAMQGVFRDPLAEPGITGVSSGAATVAVILIVTGLASTHWLVLPVGAFLGALGAVLIVHAYGARAGSTSSLLLSA